MHKTALVQALREISDLYRSTGNPGDVGRSGAYLRASNALAEYTGVVDSGETARKNINGIGKGIAVIIDQLITTGTCDVLVRLRSIVGSVPKSSGPIISPRRSSASQVAQPVFQPINTGIQFGPLTPTGSSHPTHSGARVIPNPLAGTPIPTGSNSRVAPIPFMPTGSGGRIIPNPLAGTPIPSPGSGNRGISNNSATSPTPGSIVRLTPSSAGKSNGPMVLPLGSIYAQSHSTLNQSITPVLPGPINLGTTSKPASGVRSPSRATSSNGLGSPAYRPINYGPISQTTTPFAGSSYSNARVASIPSVPGSGIRSPRRI